MYTYSQYMKSIYMKHAMDQLMLMQEAEDTHYWLCTSESGKKLIDKRKVMLQSSSKAGQVCTTVHTPTVNEAYWCRSLREAWASYRV